MTVNGKDYYLLNIARRTLECESQHVLNYPAKVPGTYSAPTGNTFTNPTQRKYVFNKNGVPVTTSTMPGHR